VQPTAQAFVFQLVSWSKEKINLVKQKYIMKFRVFSVIAGCIALRSTI
jgi:hypothetical protein